MLSTVPNDIATFPNFSNLQIAAAGEQTRASPTGCIPRHRFNQYLKKYNFNYKL